RLPVAARRGAGLPPARGLARRQRPGLARGGVAVWPLPAGGLVGAGGLARGARALVPGRDPAPRGARRLPALPHVPGRDRRRAGGAHHHPKERLVSRTGAHEATKQRRGRPDGDPFVASLLRVFPLSVLPILLAAAACAGPLAAARATPAPSADTEAGWRELADGHSARAAERFERATAGGAREPLADFGRATIAFERGEGGLALERYLSVVEAAARGGDGGGWGALLAAAAVGRIDTLMDETPGAAVAASRAEQRLLAIAPERLPWEARVELGQAIERIARRRGDV